jgi:anti-sigma factor RsiW
MIDEIAANGSAMVKAIDRHLGDAYDAYLVQQITLAIREHEAEMRQRRYRRHHMARHVVMIATAVLGSLLLGALIAELMG